MCKLYFFVNDLAYTASILLLMVIAAERYIAIIHPLRSRGFFTVARLFVAQIVVWVVAAAYNIPILIMFDTTSTPDGFFCYMSVHLMNLKTYYTVHFVLWYLVPLAVILVMYGRISCTLWATSSAITSSSSMRRDTARSFTTRHTSVDASSHYSPSSSTMFPKCCRPDPPSATCISYCETGADQNGFALVTLQPGTDTVAAGARGRGEGGREGEGGGSLKKSVGETRKGDAAVMTALSPYSMTEPPAAESSRRGGERVGPCRTSESENSEERAPTPSGLERTRQVEVVALQGCGSCLQCVHADGCARKDSAGRYSAQTDYFSYHRKGKSKLSFIKTRRKKKSEKYANELSEMQYSDDYEAYSRSQANKGHNGNTLSTRTETPRDGSCNSSSANTTPRHLFTHNRVSSPRGLTSRRRVIRLLVAVVTIFALCVLPLHLRNLLHYWNVYESPGGIFDFLSPIASVMMYLNCGLNPFIYWMFSDHFRRSLRDTLCFWKRSKRNNSRMMLHSPRQQKTSLIKHNHM